MEIRGIFAALHFLDRQTVVCYMQAFFMLVSTLYI